MASGKDLPLKCKRTNRDLYTNGKEYRYMGALEALQQPTTKQGKDDKVPVRLAPWTKVADAKHVQGGSAKDGNEDSGATATVAPIQSQLQALKAANTIAEVDELVKDEKRQPVLRAADARRKEIEAAADNK